MIRIQESTNQILDVIASIIQITGTRNFFAIYNLLAHTSEMLVSPARDSFSVYIHGDLFLHHALQKFFVDPGIRFT